VGLSGGRRHQDSATTASAKVSRAAATTLLDAAHDAMKVAAASQCPTGSRQECLPVRLPIALRAGHCRMRSPALAVYIASSEVGPRQSLKCKPGCSRCDIATPTGLSPTRGRMICNRPAWGAGWCFGDGLHECRRRATLLARLAQVYICVPLGAIGCCGFDRQENPLSLARFGSMRRAIVPPQAKGFFSPRRPCLGATPITL
jgi:hypothetical protein